jgi:hypothetical protein
VAAIAALAAVLSGSFFWVAGGSLQHVGYVFVLKKRKKHITRAVVLRLRRAAFLF